MQENETGKATVKGFERLLITIKSFILSVLVLLKLGLAGRCFMKSFNICSMSLAQANQR